MARTKDTTPGKEFVAKKIKDNGDDTADYEVPYNDENGVRKVKIVTRPVGKRGGHRKPDATPSRVFTANPKKTVIDKETGTLTLSIPFNDSNGNRRESLIVFAVDGDELTVDSGVPSENTEEELVEA